MNLTRRILFTGLTAGVAGDIASTAVVGHSGDPLADRAAGDALAKLIAGHQVARDVKGRPLGYFHSASLSYGLQAGSRSFG